MSLLKKLARIFLTFCVLEVTHRSWCASEVRMRIVKLVNKSCDGTNVKFMLEYPWNCRFHIANRVFASARNRQ